MEASIEKREMDGIMRRIGGIEAGGTKFVCGVGNERGEIEGASCGGARRAAWTAASITRAGRASGWARLSVGGAYTASFIPRAAERCYAEANQSRNATSGYPPFSLRTLFLLLAI